MTNEKKSLPLGGDFFVLNEKYSLLRPCYPMRVVLIFYA